MAKSIYDSESNALNVISSHTTIKGDIISEGDLIIEGEVKGNLNIKGKLTISKSGKVDGIINSQEGEIAGNVSGNISTKGLLSLLSESNISGDIAIGQLSIEPGAKFSGKCRMNGDNRSSFTPTEEPKIEN
jgi:cytoskeletal protein CcmA (bactofilin family)